LGALGPAGLGDAPGDRPVVGNPEDQAALAAHQSRGFRHDRPRHRGPRMAQGAKPHKQPLFAGHFTQLSLSPGRPWPEDRRGQRCLSRWYGPGSKERRVDQLGERESALSGFRQGIEAAVPALRRYARALTRNAELADDLVQDTLVRALRSEHLFHGGELRSWL